VKIPHSRWKAAWNLLSQGIWSKLPLQVLYFRSDRFKKALDTLLTEDFDLIHGFMLRLLPYLEGQGKPVLLDCNDSMQLNIGRQVNVTTGPKHWLFQEELRRLRAYEPSIDCHVQNSIFVSPIDAMASGLKKTLVLPLGVQVPPPVAPCSQPIVAFSGNMGYAPNIQAVEWFVGRCWPEIQRAVPDAIFRIIGGNVSSSVLALRGVPGVEVLGRVEDMMIALQRAAVSVAPMQSGSGMQFKVLEAMACGLPVVTTTLGLGAIKAGVNQEILIANEPSEFAQIVIRLLMDGSTRMALGERARRFVQVNHSWEWIASEVERCYINCISH
jgi:hypothetical protein